MSQDITESARRWLQTIERGHATLALCEPPETEMVRELLAEITRLRAELAKQAPVVEAAGEWYETCLLIEAYGPETKARRRRARDKLYYAVKAARGEK